MSYSACSDFHLATSSALSAASASPRPTPPSLSLQFRNYDEAMQALVTRPILRDYLAPQSDPTLPRSQIARDSYIRQLYDSFVDTSSCIDRENTVAFVSRWQGIANNTSPYTPADIETCCHKLLEIAMDLHTRGPRSLMVFDRVKLEQAYKYRGLTFAQRINSVCELLRLSKARCQALMRFDGLDMAVATAPLMARQTKMNSALNGKRQEILVRARALKDGEAEEEEEEEEEEEGEDGEVGGIVESDSGLHLSTSRGVNLAM